MLNLRRTKENKGITLVALVVTIIVLLILAGITIAMLTGENGIIRKAFEAKDATEYAQIEEEVALAWTETQTEKLIQNLSSEETAKYLENVLKQNDSNTTVEYREENGTYEVNYKDYMFEIQEDGNISTNREEVVEDIKDAWEQIDDSLSNEEKADQLEEILKEQDPDVTVEYNPDTGKIEIDYGDYEVELDPETGEITIKEPSLPDVATVIITKEPTNVSVYEGKTATFTVEARTVGEVTYQWYRGDTVSASSGEAIPGANEASYTTPAPSSNNGR